MYMKMLLSICIFTLPTSSYQVFLPLSHGHASEPLDNPNPFHTNELMYQTNVI